VRTHRNRVRSIALALTCLQCASPPAAAPRTATRTPAPVARPERPSSLRVWIYTNVVHDDEARTDVQISPPVLVELDRARRISSLPGAQPAFRSHLGEEGVGNAFLYAARTTDGHFDRADGPVIVTYPPGARVEIDAYDGRWIEIRRTIQWHGEERSYAIFVDASSLTSERIPLGDLPPLSNARAEWFRASRVVSAAPGEPPFGRTLCEPMRVLEEVPGASEPALRVAQWSMPDGERDELSARFVGWLGPPLRTECPPRVFRRMPADPSDVPANFVRFDDAHRPDPGTLFSRGGTAYALRIENDDGQTVCWQIRVRRRSGTMIERATIDGLEYVRTIDYYRFENGLLILGPGISTRTLEHGRSVEEAGYGGDFVDTLVAVSNDGWQWLPGREVAAYHPDDTERWYRTAAACQAARRSAAL
jgi:hypothetical protein